MLSPISKIKCNPVYFHSKCRNTNISMHQFSGFKSIYDSPISFTHYMGFKDCSTTNNPDYFKLPQTELSDGTIYQFTPDKSQIKCAQKLLQGDSVLYCAPTGTGKTAAIHFAVNKNLDENKKTIITVPLVALANDKYREFSKIYGTENTGIMTGDRKINSNAPIVIMTTEILYNQANDIKDDTGTIVFDEAHYISDIERGNVWEKSIIASVPKNIQILCLSATVGNSEEFANWISSLNDIKHTSNVEISPKERYVPLVWQIYNPKNKDFTPFIEYSIDVSGLSADNLNEKQKRAISRIYQIQNNKNEFFEPQATQMQEIIDSMKNSLREWYQSVEDFEEDFLLAYPDFKKEEVCEISHLLRNEDDKYVKNIYVQPSPHDDFKTLIQDLEAQKKLPALIFKLSRNACDEVANDLYKQEVDLTNDEEKKQIKEIIDNYQGYLGKNINKDMLYKGYGVHHAGKLPEYRKLIEELFSKKLLKVVISTSTLSAGINMPARTVVLSDMTYRRYNPHTKELEDKTLTVNEFHQMAGRAGRRGIDRTGNVVLYNLKAIPKKYKSEEHNKNRIDELELAYNYVSSKADNLRSQFRPDPVLISRYYSENSDNSALTDLINKTFGFYCAKDKDSHLASKLRKFENYSQVLLKQGFLYRDYKNQYILTPKGKMLQNAIGANPLMTVNLVYDGLLDNVTPVELSQIAGYIAGSDEVQEPVEIEAIVNELLNAQIGDDKKAVKNFQKLRNSYKQKEDKLLKALNESKTAPCDIISSDNISGYILYLWSYFNQTNPDTIENFEKITSLTYKTDKKEIKSMLSAKLSEGNVYRVISHSVSVLKQIIRICDYALSDNDNYPNSDYYADLKEKAITALDLIERKPITIEDI